MKRLPNDPIIEAMRAKYPKKGPNPKPGEDIDHWAERYLKPLRSKIEQAETLLKQKRSIEDISRITGLRKEQVAVLLPKNKKEDRAYVRED